MKISRQRFAVISMLTLFALFATACAPGSSPAPTATKAPAASPTKPAEVSKPTAPTPTALAATATPKPATIKIGYMRTSAMGGFYYAWEKGFFREQGIEIDGVPIGTMTDAIGPLSTGEFDIGQGSMAAGLFNAIERGVDLRLVAGVSELPVGNKYVVWLIRKGLVGQIKDYSDWKGRKIAISGKGALGELALSKALDKGKLTPAAVDMVVMTFPDMVAALKNGSIDVAYGLEPYVSQVIEQGTAEVWRDMSDVIPNYQIGSLLASRQLAMDKRDAAQRFMVGWVKGVREYTDVFFKKKGDKAGLIAALTKYTGVTDVSIYDRTAPAALTVDGYVDTKNVVDQLDWYMSAGYVKTRPTIDKLVDNGFAEYAVQKLGKYQ